MKKPTREQILERMARNLVVGDAPFVSFDELYRITEDELIEELNPVMLTKKQRECLSEDLLHLCKASRHTYFKIRFMSADGLGEVRFYYKNHLGVERYDMIAGKPCYTSNMVVGRIYKIEELLP